MRRKECYTRIEFTSWNGELDMGRFAGVDKRTIRNLIAYRRRGSVKVTSAWPGKIGG